MQSESELYKSFDATVWAREFVRIVRSHPTIPTDEGCMASWFASAIMRGYDEHHWRSKEYKRMVRRAMVPWWKRWFVPLDRFGR